MTAATAKSAARSTCYSLPATTAKSAVKSTCYSLPAAASRGIETYGDREPLGI